MDSVFVRIATLSAEALTPEGTVRTLDFLAACSEVLPIIGERRVLLGGNTGH